MTTYAGMPRVAAASASAAAWLPDECAATPLRASVSESDCTAFVAPRYLNAPMRCTCSPFRYAVVPSHSSNVLLVAPGCGARTGRCASRRRARRRTWPALVARGQDAFEEVVEAEEHDEEREDAGEPRCRVPPPPEQPPPRDADRGDDRAPAVRGAERLALAVEAFGERRRAGRRLAPQRRRRRPGSDDLAGTSFALMTSRSRAENFGLQVVSVSCASGVLSTT